MRTKWEYMTIDGFHGGNPTQLLNEQGEQGWELVFIMGPLMYFKRPKAAEGGRLAA